MLKILIVTNLYPNSLEPTRGIFTEQIVQNLIQKHEVKVVAPTPWFPSVLSKLLGRNDRRLPEATTHNGVEVFHPSYIVIPKVGRWLYGILFFFGVFNRLRKLKKSFNPDVINVHWMYPDAFGTVLAARLLKIPVVTHSLGCDINEFSKYPSRRFFISQALKKADHNISVSEELRHKTIKLGSDESKATTIMNGVNASLFKRQDSVKLRKQLELPLDKTLFLFAGNFNVEKGLSVLLKAFSKIHTEFDDARLVVVGSGPLQSEIDQLTDELGLINKVIFKGRIPHSEVPNYLSAVDFLCLPSLREGCPNIVLESLTSGTPVLSSRVGAVPEMLQSESQTLGLLAKPNDADDLSRILKQSLTMDWDRPLDFHWMSWEESADAIAGVLAKAANKAA